MHCFLLRRPRALQDHELFDDQKVCNFSIFTNFLTDRHWHCKRLCILQRNWSLFILFLTRLIEKQEKDSIQAHAESIKTH